MEVDAALLQRLRDASLTGPVLTPWGERRGPELLGTSEARAGVDLRFELTLYETEWCQSRMPGSGIVVKHRIVVDGR